MDQTKETKRLEPHRRLLFKPIENSETGGCHIDVFLPKTTSGAPIAMMIHGGAWTIGGSGHLPPDQINYLLDEGFAVVSPEYRLAPHVTLRDCVEDLLDAYRWTTNDMNGALDVELDTSRTCVMGWSAGGTGTLLLTDAILRHGLTRPRAILPTYPKTDNERGWNEPMQAFLDQASDEEKADLTKLLAQPVCTNYPIKRQTFMTSSDARIIWARATMRTKTLNTWLCGQDSPYPRDLNPMDVVDGRFPPTMVVVATGDQLIPPADSYDLVEMMKKAGVDVSYFEAKGMPHGMAEAARDTWPEDQDWWNEAIVPSLEWVVRTTRSTELQ